MSTQILKRKRFTRVALEFSTYLVFTETWARWVEKEFDGASSSVAVWDGPTTARNMFVGAVLPYDGLARCGSDAF